VGGRHESATRLCPPGAKLSHTALRLQPGLSFEEWKTTGLRLCEFSSASAWWLGDWLLYGEETYGKRYEEALKLTPLRYQTLRNYAWVARRFPLSCRRDAVSFQHHAEVAAMPEADRDLWLQRAERMRWPRNELRRHLVAARQADRARMDRAEIVRFELSGDRYDHWRRAAAAAAQPLLDWLLGGVDAAAATSGESQPSLWGHDALSDFAA
jgi:hypothetical protein